MYSLTIEDSNGQIAEKFSFDHGSYLIGRQQNCDIVLPSTSVSRRHATIFIEDGRCYIEDLNSANGVTVDGQRVVKQRHLGTASQIRVGDYYLYLEYQGGESLEDQNVRQTLFISDSPDHKKIVRVNDEFAGEEFSLSEVENTIGRTDDNFILLSDPSISREHALIRRDGEDYTLLDLGSSNGTRLNGNEVLDPKPVNPGDVVEFGNVEFVFAHGDEFVDASSYDESGGKNSNTVLLVSVVGVVLLVGLVAGGLIVFGVWSLNENGGQASPAATNQAKALDSEIAPLLAEGRENLDDREWDKAIESFNNALAIAPNHQKANQLRETARHEKKAESLRQKAVTLSEEGEHSQALETLQKISEDTVASKRARSTLEHVRKTLSFKLRNEADELIDSGQNDKWKDAHENLFRAVELAPEDDKASEMLGELEDRMEDRGIAFEPRADR